MLYARQLLVQPGDGGDPRGVFACAWDGQTGDDSADGVWLFISSQDEELGLSVLMDWSDIQRMHGLLGEMLIRRRQ